MMTIVIIVICSSVIGLIALWFSPLRLALLRCLSLWSRFKFTGKIERIIDESLPTGQDELFRVQMIGQILTPCDNMDTDVTVEFLDVTEGPFHPDMILSVDEKYRDPDGTGIAFTIHNGVVPHKNAVLSSWVTITEIPCHILRFAFRGRRKLQIKIAIQSHETGEVLVSDRQTIEYVSCRDGYKQLQDRKLNILKSTIELAVMLGNCRDTIGQKVKQRLTEWLEQKAQSFPAAETLAESIDSLGSHKDSDEIEQTAEELVAYGDQADKLAATELALQVAADGKTITPAQFKSLAEIAQRLDIKQDRFLNLCQKILLVSDCKIEDPSLLLGIDESMDEQIYRDKLNREYRKWNARVTHPDEQIRCQADKMLSLIAELRSRRVGQTCP